MSNQTPGAEVEEELHEALGRSQRLGFLGDRAIPEVIEHARSFVAALADVSGSLIDLGAGGGVPGLVIAVDRPDLRITLLDRRTKRTDFLSQMTRRMRLTDRVSVVAADVDDAIRSGHINFDAAVARGFGPPEFTLRSAVRCVRPGGVIVISEPPTDTRRVADGRDSNGSDSDRWDGGLLDELGLERTPSDSRVVRFVRTLTP